MMLEIESQPKKFQQILRNLQVIAIGTITSVQKGLCQAEIESFVGCDEMM